MVEGRQQLLRVVLWPPHELRGACAHTHTCLEYTMTLVTIGKRLTHQLLLEASCDGTHCSQESWVNKHSLTVLHEKGKFTVSPPQGLILSCGLGAPSFLPLALLGGSLGTSLVSFPCRSRHTWFVHVLLTTRSQQTRQRLDSESD